MTTRERRIERRRGRRGEEGLRKQTEGLEKCGGGVEEKEGLRKDKEEPEGRQRVPLVKHAVAQLIPVEGRPARRL